VSPLLEALERPIEALTRSWVPAVEILILAVGIYLLLRFLQGTRGEGVLRGLATLVAIAAAFAAVKFFGMDRLSWILERMLAISVVAAVILFQPELRRMLVRLGQNPLLRFFVRPRSLSLVDAIVESAASLSARGAGALVAIQREVGLGAIIEGGTPVDAKVSAELLNTIFHPNTPLHDGGVVIRRGRIAAAGCLFPLSENPALGRELGTRHRAAVGVTEETDAVTVVVSEETSRISVGMRGNLLQGVSVEDLRSILRDTCAEALGPDMATGD
jgi:diadenylate cyclase